MNAELDLDDLSSVRDWLARKLGEQQLRRDKRQLTEVMTSSMLKMNERLVPQVMAEPTADLYRSVTSLEQSAATDVDESETQIQQLLVVVRQRTQILRNILAKLENT